MKGYRLKLILILLFLLFSSWLAPGLNNFKVLSTSSEFESIHSWLPLIKSVQSGNLFPSQPNLYTSSKAFLFYPYLTLWIYGLIDWVMGINGIIFLSTVVFPISSFYLLYRIFYRQLDEIWSIAVSLTCILAFSDWPFRSFIFGIIKGVPISQLTTIQPLEIAHYPIPSLTVMIFLIIFYFSTQNIKLTFKRISFYTCLWGLYGQIHAVDALYGLAFWFIYFPIRFYKQSGNQLHYSHIKTIASQVLIGLILFVTPILFIWEKSSLYNSIEEIGLITTGSTQSSGLFYFAAYFFLPLILTAIVFFVKKIDPYEILTRFIHVYILLIVEFVLLTSNLLFSLSFQIDIVQNRITLFFLHFYYYAPFIYLVTRSTSYTFSHGLEAKGIIKIIEHGMNLAFNRFNRIYLPLVIGLLFIFAGASSYQSYLFYKDNGEQSEKEILHKFNEINNILPKGSVLVSEEPATNLLLLLDKKDNYKTLWVNRFTHDLPSDEIIDRLLLYAHIYDWPKKKIVQFLSPGRIQERRGAIVNLSLQKIHESGVGYWLAQHKRRMSKNELDEYLSELPQRYDDLNPNGLIEEFGVTHIYSTRPISTEILINSVTKLGNGSLYHVSK